MTTRNHLNNPDWWQERMAHIDELAALPQGWQDDAAPPAPEAIEVTRQMLGAIRALTLMAPVPPRYAPQIVATNDGGTQIEWHERGWDVEIAISATGRIETWAWHKETDQQFAWPPDEAAPAT